MITEDYVNFEIAKLLKEKGYDCAEITVVEQENGKDCYISNVYLLEPNELSANGYYAPTIQKVMKWLREVHKLHITIYSCSQESWMYRITKPHQKLEDGAYAGDYASYEETCKAAIKYCLENLV